MRRRIDPVGIDLTEPSDEVAFITEINVCILGFAFLQNMRVAHFIRTGKFREEVWVSLTEIEWITVIYKRIELAAAWALHSTTVAKVKFTTTSNFIR